MNQIVENHTYPTDWEEKKLGDLGVFLKGKGISKNDKKETGYPCILYGEIYTRHHNYIKDFYSFIDEETASKSMVIKKGDILFAGSGETKEEIGKSVAYLDDTVAYAGGDIIILRTKDVNAQYLAYSLNHGKLAVERAKLGQGHSVVHIYSKELTKLSISLPLIEEQNKIVSILSSWDKAIELKEKLIEQKKEQNKGLMQKLLKGEVRLPNFQCGWKETLMSDCVEIMNGYPFKSNFFNEEKGIPLIRIRDIKAKKLTTFYNGEYSKEYLVNNGDVLIGMDGEFNITMWNKGIGLLNQRVMKIETKPGHDKYFIYQLLIPLLSKVEDLTPSTTVKHLSNKDIYNLLVKIPSYEEQVAIGKILLNSDKEIELLESEVYNLIKQRQHLMQQLLTGKIRVKV
ncbi:restriction endonuclease subunit S [Kurthia gibsonii]|uniref:restriction endonuclease subunit S n=1 Tax=Kurthia gibsonii TaxID=33946 RepID=UPI00116B5661|nr:restriction endonuclease subunit S [Kurthia gibsonii]GED18937.1 hypothetical protein KGI01_06780 [Kurthia gibsonii]